MSFFILLSLSGIYTGCSRNVKQDDYVYFIKTNKETYLSMLMKDNGDFIGLDTKKDNEDIESSWIITSTADGYYKIETEYQRYCLAVDGDSLIASSYAGLDFQKWNIRKSGSGVTISPKNNGKLRLDFEELNLTKKRSKKTQTYFLEKNKPIENFSEEYIEQIKEGASEQVSAITDTWAATDGANRTLSTWKDVGDKRDARYVGMFYWVWHGDFAGTKVYDMTKSINETKEMNEFRIATMEEYWWAEPELGYYNANDYYVHVKNLIMMGNCGVDFIYLDYTNAVWHQGYRALFDAYDYCKENNITVPRFTFFFNVDSSKMIETAYKSIYKKGIQKDMWFYWEGKPLLMAENPGKLLDNEIESFFTYRKTWAFDISESYKWNFIDEFPSKYSYTISPSLPEYIPVIKSHGAPLVQHNTVPRKGSSFNWLQPNKTAKTNERYETSDTGLGIAFKQFWDRAIMIDPLIIGVTGLNEWTARAWKADKGLADNYTFMGKELNEGDPYLVDEFNIEFNRDIEPMKGGYTDNYYYQLVENIRRYKGMNRLPKTITEKTITIDGNFDEWESVEYKFIDISGDTLKRDAQGYIKTKEHKLVNNTGRNDFVSAKVAFDSDNIYFMIETKEAITSYTDPEWMLILIDSDMNHKTGWEGYDYIINKDVISDTKTTLMKWSDNSWVDTKVVLEYRVNGNKLEVQVPISSINVKVPSDGFYFKLADNVLGLDNIENYFVNGDTAPDRRFSYIASN